MISKEKAEFVRSLADENGNIEPERVVESARDPGSPIHGDFTWDNKEAGQAYRLDEAKRLIRFVKVEFLVEDRTISSVLYVPDPNRAPKSRRYIDVTVAARRDDSAQKILMAELDRISAAIRRAYEIAEVLGLTDQLDHLLAETMKIRAFVEKKVSARKKKSKPKGNEKPMKRKPNGPPELRT